jgi:hypothetical protein
MPREGGLGLELAGQNPVASAAPFTYDLPRAGHATVTVHDVLGRRVATLVDSDQPAGRHSATWNVGAPGRGRAAPGLYFVRLRVGSESVSRRCLVAY